MTENVTFDVYLLISDFLVESLKAKKIWLKYNSFFLTAQNLKLFG